MVYLSDTQRVEMALPVHMMLSVLVAGANCTPPRTLPADNSPKAFLEWKHAWDRYNDRLKDPEFKRSVDIFEATKKLLVQACDEALDGVFPEKKAQSLLRRIQRIHHEIVQPYIHGKDADPRKIGIIAFYLIQHLVDTGLLIIPEESSFGRALDHMLPALSPWEGSTESEIEDYERINRSARKQVRKLLHHLQREGYYKGIPLPEFESRERATVSAA